MSALNSNKESTIFSKYRRFTDSMQDHLFEGEIKIVLGRHFLLQIRKLSDKGAFNKIEQIQNESISDEEKERLDKDKKFYFSKANNLLITNKENWDKLVIMFEKEQISNDYEMRKRRDKERSEHMLLRIKEETEFLNSYLAMLKSDFNRL